MYGFNGHAQTFTTRSHSLLLKQPNPIVAPLRRVIPSIGSVDMATILFGYLLCVAKFILLQLALTGGAFAFSPSFLLLGLLALVKAAGGLLFWVLLIRAILSWVSSRP